MHLNILRLAMAAAAVAVTCRFGKQAISAEQHRVGGIHKSGAQNGQRIPRNVNRSSHVQPSFLPEVADNRQPFLAAAVL